MRPRKRRRRVTRPGSLEAGFSPGMSTPFGITATGRRMPAARISSLSWGDVAWRQSETSRAARCTTAHMILFDQRRNPRAIGASIPRGDVTSRHRVPRTARDGYRLGSSQRPWRATRRPLGFHPERRAKPAEPDSRRRGSDSDEAVRDSGPAPRRRAGRDRLSWTSVRADQTAQRAGTCGRDRSPRRRRCHHMHKTHARSIATRTRASRGASVSAVRSWRPLPRPDPIG